MKTPSTGHLLRALHQALYAAGDVVRRAAKAPITITHKSLVDLVTPADRAAERKILSTLRSHFPDHGFLMEESGAKLSRSAYRWVVDPIDGTVNFAHGIPICGVSVAVEKEGKVLAGGVYNPLTREKFIAVRGKGARLNGRLLKVSKAKRLVDALVSTGFPYDRNKNPGFYMGYVQEFLIRAQGLRRLGAASLDLCYVAAGRFGAFWEFKLKPWDSAAGWLMVEEAGGQVTNFSGRPYTLDDTSQTLATNGLLHPAMLEVLRRPPAAP